VSLIRHDDEMVVDTSCLPGGPNRPVVGELGLKAGPRRADVRVWPLSISTSKFASSVSVGVPGLQPDDSWCPLPPGRARAVTPHLVGDCASASLGQVRALRPGWAARVCRKHLGTPLPKYGVVLGIAARIPWKLLARVVSMVESSALPAKGQQNAGAGLVEHRCRKGQFGSDGDT
jgi:hypothetical protein